MKYIKGSNEFNLKKSLDGFFESFNTPVEIKWVDKNNELIGLFIVNSKVYQINCKRKENDIWVFKFYNYNVDKNELGIELTNYKTGYMSVLSTIRCGMEYLIESKKPKSVVLAQLTNLKAEKVCIVNSQMIYVKSMDSN